MDRPRKALWLAENGRTVRILDQTVLPHRVEVVELASASAAAEAIASMRVRGAPLIGATAAYGLALALAADPGEASLAAARDALLAARPTAINLRWALRRVESAVAPLPPEQRAAAAYAEAAAICREDAAMNYAIGTHGVKILEQVAATKAPGEPVNVLTHCNTGWLATLGWGTALAPLYLARERGLNVHAWVAETRPKTQGNLTAWELGAAGVAHTVIPDSAAAHLMQRGRVDLCLVGTDRVTRTGDVCNKIGTLDRAVLAESFGVGFYVALPTPTIDWETSDGLSEVPLEQRSGAELLWAGGMDEAGDYRRVRLYPEDTEAVNVAFDVTPARYVTGLVTERGVVEASAAGLQSLLRKSA